jgi:hypothetical protein
MEGPLLACLSLVQRRSRHIRGRMPMSRKIRRRSDTLRRALAVERLEDRSLLAVAAFTIELREDNGGVPGDIIAAADIAAGDCFYVEIRAQEFHPLYKGLHGVALNIAWDPSVLEEIDAGFDLAQILTENLPLFRGGTLDNAAGTIDNLSGSAFHASGIGRAIGDGTPERFALLHFRAETATAATSIRMSEGASSIVTQPAATFASSQLSFETQTLSIAAAEVLPADAPPDLPPPEPVASEPESEEPAASEPAASEPAASEPVVGYDEPADDDAIMLLTEFEPDVSDPFAAPAGDEADPPPAEPDTEIFTLSSEPAATGAADLPEPSEPADECLATPSFAEAVDVVLMGPFTPEQFAAQPANAIFRLQDLIALLALDVADRRRVATVVNQTCE